MRSAGFAARLQCMAFGKDSTPDAVACCSAIRIPVDRDQPLLAMHLTIPGQLDVMGASTGHIAACRSASTRMSPGRIRLHRQALTLYELTLVPNQPTAYVVDGRPEQMTQRTVRIDVRNPDGTLTEKTRTLWSTRWGP